MPTKKQYVYARCPLKHIVKVHGHTMVCGSPSSSDATCPKCGVHFDMQLANSAMVARLSKDYVAMRKSINCFPGGSIGDMVHKSDVAEKQRDGWSIVVPKGRSK